MKISIIIFAVITIFALWYLIVSIGSYFEAKENRIKRSLLEPVSPKINSSMIERLDFENQFLTLIDDLLNTEIACMIKSYMILGNPYPIINLDRDVKTLSDTVYNAIKKEVFVDNVHFLTDDYLMSYITKKATLLLLLSIKDITAIGTGPENNE